jgi:hypothetical protein
MMIGDNPENNLTNCPSNKSLTLYRTLSRYLCKKGTFVPVHFLDLGISLTLKG